VSEESMKVHEETVQKGWCKS